MVAAILSLAAPAPAALGHDPVYNPYQPGYHPGPPAYYERYEYWPDWFERRDTLTLQAGDALAANRAMQMRDPWPPYVQDRHILFHGEVIAGAVERYKSDEVKQPVPLTTTIGQ